jgi:hypothetical protein
MKAVLSQVSLTQYHVSGFIVYNSKKALIVAIETLILGGWLDRGKSDNPLSAKFITDDGRKVAAARNNNTLVIPSNKTYKNLGCSNITDTLVDNATEVKIALGSSGGDLQAFLLTKPSVYDRLVEESVLLTLCGFDYLGIDIEALPHTESERAISRLTEAIYDFVTEYDISDPLVSQPLEAKRA